MQAEKERILRQIELSAEREARHLAGEFARAASGEREQNLAAMEFEQWLAASCREAQEDPPGSDL